MTILHQDPDSNNNSPDLRSILDEIENDSGNEFAAQHALPDLVDALRRALTGCEHFERLAAGLSSVEARLSYRDAADHIRACIAIGLTGAR